MTATVTQGVASKKIASRCGTKDQLAGLEVDLVRWTVSAIAFNLLAPPA